MEKNIRIGWAQTDITPDRPIYVIGQLYSRISSYVHDPLTATCLALENGEEQMILVSADMPGVPTMHISRILERLDAPGLDRSRVVFSAIHTHNSTMFTKNTTYEVYFKSVLGDLCPEMEEPDDILKDEELEEFFIGKMVDLIEEAWAARRPGGVALAHEYAAVAFNRRPQFLVNGKRESKMYGDCSAPNFLGYEGPSDHSADMLYTFDEQRQLTGALVCIPCPRQVYELHRFISADYWGEVRTQLRAELGNIFVLPLCGAAGDQNPLDLVRISKDNKRELIVWNAQETEVDRSFDMLRECQQIGGRICDAVLRGYRQARNEIQTRPVFRTNCFEMDVPLRTVEKADVDAASARIEAVKAACPAGERLTEAQMIRCFEDIGYLNRWKLQQETTRFTFPIFVFRIGAAAFATNPFELYVDYSYRMKARCRGRRSSSSSPPMPRAGICPRRSRSTAEATARSPFPRWSAPRAAMSWSRRPSPPWTRCSECLFPSASPHKTRCENSSVPTNSHSVFYIQDIL